MQCKTAGTNDTSPCALPEHLDCSCLHKRTAAAGEGCAATLVRLYSKGRYHAGYIVGLHGADTGQWREIKHLGHFTALLLLKAALLPLLLAGQALWQQLAPADRVPDAEHWGGCRTSGSHGWPAAAAALLHLPLACHVPSYQQHA